MTCFRPLAVVGNTGSGKSYTIASLMQSIIDHQEFVAKAQADPHIFILDINGEYANAFWNGTNEWDSLTNNKAVRYKLIKARSNLLIKITARQNERVNFAKSTDSPRFVAVAEFRDSRLVDRSIDQESGKKIDQLTTLKLRLRTQLNDRRWQSFFSYEQKDIRSFKTWMEKLGVGQRSDPRVSVLDFSMLALGSATLRIRPSGSSVTRNPRNVPSDRRPRYQ